MTHVFNDPAAFKADVLKGFAAAYPDYVARVPDAAGFVRAGGPLDGKVSLVIGGGSGHYPSYSGVVGTGFADAGVLGDIFASPSAEQIYRVARAADGGAGIVLSFGNYAGDRLNFGVAQDRLKQQGIDARVLYVTDDVASAAPDKRSDRRGIAGTFTVYKIGGAAAEEGADLDEVERVMRAANAATFSFGVAFGGCTLPGADAPLFDVAAGRMDFGLGIHGEPGVSSRAAMPAHELAAVLVDTLLAERPAQADGRVAALLNGLGATKYEELFVLWGAVSELLEAAGLRLVGPEVGELVTSLDMAGCSLSLTWLDDELERLWTAPAQTPSFRRGAVAASRFRTHRAFTATADEATDEEASPESAAAAAVATSCLQALNDVVEANKEHLGQIDAVAGDGDHGIGMSRGSRAARSAAQETSGGIGTVLRAAGAAFGDQAGGTSGILWGTLLASMGTALGNTEAVTPQRVAAAVRTSTDELQRFSGAELGDKTMLDALLPFVDELVARIGAGENLAGSWTAAAATAVRAADGTAPLVPRIGRARPLAERSVGTPDPGAVSMGLILTAIAAVLSDGAQGSCTPA